MKRTALGLLCFLVWLPAQSAIAVEVLSADALASQCSEYAKFPENPSSKFCASYIQGFLDGAVATDARVMLSVEDEMQGGSSLGERALKTRGPKRGDYRRAAGYAGFCLGDPVRLKEVVTSVASDLEAMQNKIDSSVVARDVVYESLKKHYPCESE